MGKGKGLLAQLVGPSAGCGVALGVADLPRSSDCNGGRAADTDARQVKAGGDVVRYRPFGGGARLGEVSDVLVAVPVTLDVANGLVPIVV